MKKLLIILFVAVVAVGCESRNIDSIEVFVDNQNDTIEESEKKECPQSQEIIVDQENDSIEIHKIHNQFMDLVNLIKCGKKEKIQDLIDFPLDARSAYSFGFENNNPSTELNSTQFLEGYDHFFKKVMVDAITYNDTLCEFSELNQTEDIIYFTVIVNTFESANKERDWGIECSHKIYCYVKEEKLRINGFFLLCGGIA